MSDTTTIIVSILPPNTEPPETSKPGADCVNFWEASTQWLKSQEIFTGNGFQENSSEWGGNKVPPPEIWTGCFAHFDEAAFLQFVRSLPWIDPARVQVLIMSETGENEDKWRIFEPEFRPPRRDSLLPLWGVARFYYVRPFGYHREGLLAKRFPVSFLS